MITLNQVAPAAVAAKESDASHYYGHTPERGWHALYTPEKNYGLREARKAHAEGLVVVPSVTTYFKALHKQQILDYKIEQAIRYADANPRAGAAINEWIDTVAAKADGASHPARDRGTAIHTAIELAVSGKDYDAAMDVYVQATLKERAALNIESLGQEACCGSLAHGYGGKCDEIAEGMTIVDYKSRKSNKNKTPKVASYSTDRMQLAAYGFALFGPAFLGDGRGIIIGISTSRPGEVTPHVFSGPELREAFNAFVGLTAVWRFENSFDPRRI